MKYQWIFLAVLMVCFGSLPVQAMETDNHLTLIHAAELTQQDRNARDIVIAQLDTGVDFDHPDLKGVFLPGYNLIDSSKKPWDDNGHGTETAEILAANNDQQQGVQGVLQKAKILPIKVLDQDGNGDPKRIAEGIHLAVDHGARIILMSLEDPIYSLVLEQAVQYAEEKGVLVVASVGNDKSSVTYPAAFPTVLGVGAVNGQGKVSTYSNHGPGVDLVAPGDYIVTTDRQGAMTIVSGTSMAAPQVAAAAAIVWEKNPKLTPLQVRMLLEGTAQRVDQQGWNEYTGYGLIDLQHALQDVSTDTADVDEPNNTWKQAAAFSPLTLGERAVSIDDPVDWYRISPPYSGKLSVTLNLEQGVKGNVAAELYDEHHNKLATGMDHLEVLVSKDPVYLKISRVNGPARISYQLQTHFSIKVDAQEPNDTKQTAALLALRPDITITGNFDKPNDDDWFVFSSPSPGKLEIEVIPDTDRIDPVLGIEQVGKWAEIIDYGAAGQKESWSSQITPGKYYIHLKDYYGNAVNGEYKMKIHFVTGGNW